MADGRRAEAWERTLLSLLKTKHELTTCQEKGARDAPDYRPHRTLLLGSSPPTFQLQPPPPLPPPSPSPSPRPRPRPRSGLLVAGCSYNRAWYTCPWPPPPGAKRPAVRPHPTHCPAERFIKSLPGPQHAPASRRIPLLLFRLFHRFSPRTTLFHPDFFGGYGVVEVDSRKQSRSTHVVKDFWIM